MTAVSRKVGVSTQTMARWREKCSGMSVPDAKEKPPRRGECEAEEARCPIRFGCRFAEGGSGKKVVTASVRREVVKLLVSRGHSERRSCILASLQRSTWKYEAIRADGPKLLARIRELAAERPRFGYRRLHALLRREGNDVNRKRVYRMYRAAELAVRRRSRRKLKITRPAPPAAVTRANERWSMDFVHDYLANGRPLRTLNVIDAFTRECLAIEVDTSLPAQRVVNVLDKLVWCYGLPLTLRVDNGPEFISMALDAWASAHGVKLDFIQPGKPTQNAHLESFNGHFRDECLVQERFPTLARARAEIEFFRTDYNCERPHSSLDYRTPKDFGDIARRELPAPPGAAAALFEGVQRRASVASMCKEDVEDRIGVN